MAQMFPRVGRIKLGYDPAEVDDFFEHAREIYEGPNPGQLTVSQIQNTAFSLVRGGYQPNEVDSSMDRIAQAFAELRRRTYIETYGEEAWLQELTRSAQLLFPRLARPSGQRFAPASSGKWGYDRDEVDDLCDWLIGYFDHGDALSPDVVRSATFTARRGARGYDERSVDAFLSLTVEIMLSVG